MRDNHIVYNEELEEIEAQLKELSKTYQEKYEESGKYLKNTPKLLLWLFYCPIMLLLVLKTQFHLFSYDDALEVKLITVNVKDNAFYDGDKLLTKDDFAFDHYDLIQEAISRMQGHDSWKPNFFQMLGYEFTVTEILNLVKAILPNKNLIRQNVLREYKNFLTEVGVRRKEGIKSQKTYKYKK